MRSIVMRHKLVTLIAWLGYWLGIDAVFYWLNRRCKRVLTFHNVFPDELCRKDEGGGLSLSVSEFKEIVREIGRRFRFSTDFKDAETATLTFDDGFLNQYEVVPQALGNVAAVLFVAGQNIDRIDPRHAPAVDLLTVWLDAAPDSVTGEKGKLRYWIEDLRPAYVLDAADYGRNVVERCDKIYSFEKVFSALEPEYLRLRLGGVSSRQLDELRKNGWRVGWHSYHHFALSAIPAEKKMLEFAAPDVIRREPMSYPYGEMMSVGEEDIACAERAGFPMAFSNWPETSPRLGRYFLPRFDAPVDKYLLHFQLSGFEHFLKFRKLLPRVNL